MSSAANHRKRSHRSQARHYAASRSRINAAVYQQERKQKPDAWKRLQAFFRGRKAGDV